MEWIRPSTRDLIESLRRKYDFDFVVGSVHHVHEISIDYDRETYARAVLSSRKGKAEGPHDWLDGKEEELFIDYFDSQKAMLEALQPPVVGHFDLVRLLSTSPNRSLQTSARVWRRVQRNLELVRGYGGFLEVNSSGLRKGLAEPYPAADICKVSGAATWSRCVVARADSWRFRALQRWAAALSSLTTAMASSRSATVTLTR